MMRTFAFRVDMSRAIGGGHFFRCLALAQALQAAGQRVVFVVNQVSTVIEAPLEKLGIPCLSTQVEDVSINNGLTDATATATVLFSWQVTWLIVDHYQFDSLWEQTAKSALRCSILAIDDLANRTHVADILLDYNAWTSVQQNYYASLLTESCECLFGAQYVLLRDAFLSYRTQVLSRSVMPMRRVLCFFGATDPAQMSGLALTMMALRPFYQFDLVLGVLCPGRDLLLARAARLSHVRVWVQPEHFVDLLTQADAVICAGGTALWELFCLGHYPTVVTVADNQRNICENFSRMGYINLLGAAEQIDVAALCQAIDYLAAFSVQEWQQKRKHCYDFVDGLGCERVVARLLT